MLDSRATHNLGHRPGLPNKKLGGVCMTMTKRLPRYLDDHQDLGTTYKRGQLAIHGFTSYIYIYIYILYIVVLTWGHFYIYIRPGSPSYSSTTRASSPGVAIVSPGTNGGPSPGGATRLHLRSVLYLARVTQYDLCYAANQLTRVASKRVDVAVHGYSAQTRLKNILHVHV